MFRLTKFDISDSGVDLAFIYDMNDGKDNRIEQHFEDASIANAFVQKSEKAYILNKLSKFVLHKKVQSQVERKWNKHSCGAKLHSLDICINEAERLKDASVWTVANSILRIEDHLRAIVHDEENCYEGEYNKLDTIIYTCREHLTALRKNIA